MKLSNRKKIIWGLSLIFGALWGGTWLYLHLPEDYHLAGVISALIVFLIGINIAFDD